MEICIGQLFLSRNPGKQGLRQFLRKINHLKVCQELEAPAVNALREIRKWTHNPSATHRSWMESIILVNTNFFSHFPWLIVVFNTYLSALAWAMKSFRLPIHKWV